MRWDDNFMENLKRRRKWRIDEFTSYYDKKISMCPSEHGYVHRHPSDVRFVQSNAEVSFAAEKKQNENANVHQTDASWNEIDENENEWR